MARKEANEPFKNALRRIWQGLAAQGGKEEKDVIEDMYEELAARDLLPTKSVQEGSNPLIGWSKGFVPSDRRVVDLLVEVGFRQAKLPEKWVKEFLTAAGYSPDLIRAIISELSSEQADLSKGVLNNLPQRDPARFVGRLEELEELKRLVSSRERAWAISIDGIGGVGKTELALELADWFRQNYATLPKGERFEVIIWITFKQDMLTATGIRPRPYWTDTLSDAYVTIAHALGRPELLASAERSRHEAIRDALSRQRTLLIIDNFETARDSGLEGFIQDLPRPTKAIVTTRHRIDVARPIRLMGMPRADALRFIAKEAEQKYVTLTEEAAGRLYEATGGTPLALIWSIGKMAIGYTVDAVLESLRTSDADISKYTFESSVQAIEHQPAYDLLLGLTLFAGDAPRQGLGFVGGLEKAILLRDQELSRLELLSLVNRDPSTDRFSLLPLTRSYSASRLDSAPTVKQTYFRRLVAYYESLVLSEEVVGPDRYWLGLLQFQLAELLEREWVNIKDNLYQLHEQEEHGHLLTLGLPLVHLLDHLGLHLERLGLCRWMVESARALGDPVEAWLLIDGIGWMLHLDKQDDAWLEVIREGRRVADSYGKPEGASALADVHEAYICINRAGFTRARQLLEQAEQWVKRTGAKTSIDPILRVVANRLVDRWVKFYEAKGDYSRARDRSRESLKLRHSIGEDPGYTHYYIGHFSLKLNELLEAEDSFAKALQVTTSRRCKGLARYGLAQVAERREEWYEARRQGQLAVLQLEELGLEQAARDALALVERVRGR